jgi:hypothetical protein
LTLVSGDVQDRSQGGCLIGFRMAWNLFALTSGPFAFGFGIYLLTNRAWWEGVGAMVVAPLLGLALIAAATVVEALRKEPTILTAPLGGLLWARSGDVGGNANSLG